MTNMTKGDLIKVIAGMDKVELEKIAIQALKANAVPEAVAEEAKPVPAKAKRTKLNATDADVALVQEGKTVTFGNLPKDIYGALKAKAEVLGGAYDKAVKGFVFEAKANATKFAKITKVTAEERNQIRAGWGWK